MSEDISENSENINQELDALDIINTITSQLNKTLVSEFLKLPKEAQTGLVLTKSVQLLLANVLCQVTDSKDELEQLLADHTAAIKTLTLRFAQLEFSRKFTTVTH
jgi:hypothetical protein